jgi:hypothetical protein
MVAWANFTSPTLHRQLNCWADKTLTQATMLSKTTGSRLPALANKHQVLHTGSQRTSDLTELAIKHSSCAWWCIWASSSWLGW